MKRFLRQQLQDFLEAVDAALDHPVEVVVIGGSAAALHYGVTAATRDIDTWTHVGKGLATAAAPQVEDVQETGLAGGVV